MSKQGHTVRLLYRANNIIPFVYYTKTQKAFCIFRMSFCGAWLLSLNGKRNVNILPNTPFCFQPMKESQVWN